MKKISDVLEDVLRELKASEHMEYGRALEDWASIVGPRVAAHSKPLGIQNRTIIVEVEGSVWSQEISFIKSAAVQAVNTKLGRALIKDIRCHIADRKQDAPPPKEKRNTTPKKKS